MSHFRGNACRFFLFTILLSTTLSHSALFAECADLVAEVEKASARPQFRFSTAGNIRSMPVISGKVVRGATAMLNDLMYFTITGPNADYALVAKSITGFGFSAAPIQKFELIDSDSVVLQDLQVDGSQSFFLAAISGAKTPDAVVLKIATVSDGETGQISLASMNPLAIEKVDAANLKLSARPGEPTFWITDGSDRLRIVSLGEKGLEITSDFSAAEILGQDPKGKAYSKIESVAFSADGALALVTASSESGERYIVPIKMVETPTDKKDEMIISYASLEEKAFLLNSGEKLSIRPDKNLVVLYSEMGVRGLALNSETADFSVVMDESVDFLYEGETISGFGFYWEGQLVQGKAEKEGEKPKNRFVGEVKTYVLVYNAAKNETSVRWLNFGKSLRASMPAKHSSVNTKRYK